MNILNKARKDLQEAKKIFLDRLEAALFDTHFALAKEELEKLIALAEIAGARQQIYALFPPKEEKTDAKD